MISLVGWPKLVVFFFFCSDPKAWVESENPIAVLACSLLLTEVTSFFEPAPLPPLTPTTPPPPCQQPYSICLCNWQTPSTLPWPAAYCDFPVKQYLTEESRLAQCASLQALSTCASAFASIGYYSQTFLNGAADFIARDPMSIGLQVMHMQSGILRILMACQDIQPPKTLGTS